ncbi:MAG: Asp-tRNA(Asn)/Glu-tRNA(Gln) amidotransferase subunit GatC [Owenweeksia sp.]
MKINKKEVEKLAHLSRLEFTEEEKENMVADMDKILGFVEKISELDLEGVEPLVYMTDEESTLRKDEVVEQATKEEALKNAPDRDTDYFRVPKVVQRKGE